MPFKPILILPLVLAVSACNVAPANECAGWRPVRLSSEAVDYLAANDPQALAGLIAHHEFGQAQGCWR